MTYDHQIRIALALLHRLNPRLSRDACLRKLQAYSPTQRRAVMGILLRRCRRRRQHAATFGAYRERTIHATITPA